MMMNTFYQAKPIKTRATREQLQARRNALSNIVAELQPCTVRQCFYQATVRRIIEKSERGYDKIQWLLTKMRREDEIPYGWLVDNTRWQRKPRTYGSPSEAIEQCAEFYRKSLWRTAGSYVEVWLEKDALAGVLFPVTSSYDVPLMVARGYSSLSFLHSSAECLKELDVPAHILHLGDFDPSGVNAGEKIEETLREMAPQAEIVFRRLAVNPQQIEEWGLPSRPTKTSDSRAKRFGDRPSVELDAIHPDKLRGLVEQAILEHFNEHELSVLREAEESEKSWLKTWANLLSERKPDEKHP